MAVAVDVAPQRRDAVDVARPSASIRSVPSARSITSGSSSAPVPLLGERVPEVAAGRARRRPWRALRGRLSSPIARRPQRRRRNGCVTTSHQLSLEKRLRFAIITLMEAATRRRRRPQGRVGNGRPRAGAAARVADASACFGSDGGAVIRGHRRERAQLHPDEGPDRARPGRGGRRATVKRARRAPRHLAASASRAVDGLVKRELATRVEDAEDRRVRRVVADRRRPGARRRADGGPTRPGSRRFVEHARRRRAAQARAPRSRSCSSARSIADVYRTHRKGARK